MHFPLPSFHFPHGGILPSSSSPPSSSQQQSHVLKSSCLYDAIIVSSSCHGSMKDLEVVFSFIGLFFFFAFSNNSKKQRTIIVFQPILGRDLESSQKMSFSLLALVRFSCQQRHFPMLRSLLNMIFALLLYNAGCADGASRSKIKRKLHCIFKWIPSSGNHGS